MTQATLLVRHQVEDYAAWRSVYDSVDRCAISTAAPAQR